MQRLYTNRTKLASIGLLTLALWTVAADFARANEGAFKVAIRSTVMIIAPEGKGFSLGTGVVVDVDNRLVVTNVHVVGSQKQVQMVFPRYRGGLVIQEQEFYLKDLEKNWIEGTVLALDKKADLALVQLKSIPRNALKVKLADKAPNPGQAVHAIGSSGWTDGVLWRYSKGEVRASATTRKMKVQVDNLKMEVTAKVLETQVPTNKGDSGGPVFNDRGELVAITESQDPVERVVTYSIDVSEVRKLLQNAGFGNEEASPRASNSRTPAKSQSRQQPPSR